MSQIGKNAVNDLHWLNKTVYDQEQGAKLPRIEYTPYILQSKPQSASTSSSSMLHNLTYDLPAFSDICTKLFWQGYLLVITLLTFDNIQVNP
jgi:hypothetical protein